MKRILAILLVLSFVQSYGQKTQQSLGTKHTMVVALSDFKVDSLLFLPERDTTFTPYKNGAVVLKQSDSSLYYYAQYWRPMGGAFVKTVYKRNDSLFYQRGGAEYFVAKWGLRAFTVPAGLTATQIGDSIAVTSVLNGLVIGNGSGFSTATVDTPLYFSNGMLRIAKASNDSSGYLSYFDWRAFNAKVDPSREVNGVMSITGGGPLNQNRNLSLVNDQLAPPASYYYGTNTVGVKGWFALPEGGGTSPVTSVHGRIGDIVAEQGDYSDYYALLGHTHGGLAPIGGSTGQVLKKLSNNNYDYAWMDDLNDPGSSTGVFVDTIARVGNDLVWRKNFTDYTLEKVWNQYKAGNGLKLSNDTFSLKHITVTADSNILIGTQVNDGHKFYLKGQPRIDIGSDATGDTYYRDALGGMARLPKPTGLSKPVLGFDGAGVKPYWKEDEGSDTTSLSNRINGKQNIADTNTVDATRYWVNTQGFLKWADTVSLSTRINESFTSLTQLNDSTIVFNRPNGLKDTVVIAFSPTTSGGPSVTGGSFSGTTSKTHTLTLSDGSTVAAGSFTDLGVTINNNADNRLLTSNGANTTLEAEGDLTFSSGILSTGGIQKPILQMLSNSYTNNTGLSGVPSNAVGRLYGNTLSGLAIQGYSDATTRPGARLQGFTSAATGGTAPVVIEGMRPGGALKGYPLAGADSVMSVYTGHYDSAGVLLSSLQANGNQYIKGTIRAEGVSYNGSASLKMLVQDTTTGNFYRQSIPSGGGSVTIDQTLTDGSTNAISNNAVYDGLQLKLGKSNGEVYARPLATYSIPASSGATTPIEFFNIGENTLPGNSAQLVPTGFGKNNWSILQTWNCLFDSVNKKWLYKSASHPSHIYENGWEGITLHAVAAGTNLSDTWHEQFQVRSTGVDGTAGLNSGIYNQSKTTMYFKYKGGTYGGDDTHPWTGGASRTNDPFIWLHSEEAKGSGADVSNFMTLENNAGTTGNGGGITFRKSGGSWGSKSAVGSGWNSGMINFNAHDGSTYQNTARIIAYTDAAATSGVAPQSLVFMTSATNQAGLATRLKLHGNGTVQFPTLAAPAGNTYGLYVDENGNLSSAPSGSGGGSSLTINTNADNRLLTANGGSTSINAEANLTWDGATFNAGTGTGSNPVIRISDADATPSDFSTIGFSPALGSNEVGRLTTSNSTFGGMQFIGRSANSATTVPLFFSAYSGSTAPTVAGMVFRSAKHNGGTDATALANSEVAVEFRNWSTTIGTIKGNGDLSVTGSLTGSIAASGSTGSTFLTHTSGLIQSRTAAQVRSDIGAQGVLTLTTTGTSGPATLVGNTLNIPQYSGGGGETNTASNVGDGTGVVAGKVNADLQFKSLKAGTNIGITNDATTVTIAAPGDLVTFTPRFSAGAGQGDANIVIPVGHLFTELMPITVGSNLTVGLSTSSTSGGVTLYHIISNTNTNPTYNWQYSATVKKADGTVITEVPKGKTHTVLYITSGSYWMLTNEY